MQLILASRSPYRRQLLERLGIPFVARAPSFVEEHGTAGCDPAALVVANALGKARSLAADHPDGLLIGSDQVAECQGEILTKPGTPEAAVAQLLRLAGREHRLLTGLALVRGASAAGRCDRVSPPDRGSPSHHSSPPGLAHEETRLVVNHLRMRPLSRRQAEDYVARDRPIDCAGAYRSEGLGIALFEYLRGDDPTAIVGLPLIALCDLLGGLGLDPLGRSGGIA